MHLATPGHDHRKKSASSVDGVVWSSFNISRTTYPIQDSEVLVTSCDSGKEPSTPAWFLQTI
jgi:hypothetical protein